MMSYIRVFLFPCVLVCIGLLSGCATTTQNSNRGCPELSPPKSYKTYVYMSDEYNPPEKVAQALANDTVYWLLQLKREVKLVKNIEEVGTDGLLLRIDIIRVTGGVFRRVDAKYQILNNETNETIIDKMDAYKTRFGYNKITRKLGKKLAIKVNNLIDCFENGRNKT